MLVALCKITSLADLQVFGLIQMWAWLFVGLGIVSAVATVFKIALFSLAGDQLTYRLRYRALSRILRHSLEWFDRPSSASVPGLLTSDPPLISGVSQLGRSLTNH